MITITSGRAKAVFVSIQKSILNIHKSIPRAVRAAHRFKDVRSGVLNIVICGNNIDITHYQYLGKCNEVSKNKRYAINTDSSVPYMGFNISCDQLLSRLPSLRECDIESITFNFPSIIFVIDGKKFVLETKV